MFDNIAPPLTELNTIAGWFLGSGFAMVVVGGVVMVFMWGVGALASMQEWSAKGRIGVALYFLAALLLGSIGGGIQWSSTKDRTEGLLPEAAKQKTIRVDREAPFSKCTNQVSISAKNHLGGKKDKATGDAGERYKPSEAEAGKMGKAIREIGADQWPAESAETKTIQWGGRFGDLPAKEDWKENRDDYFAKHTPMYSRIQWQPDGAKGNCDNTNFNAAKGAPVEVIFWEVFTKSAGDKGKPNYTEAEYGYRKFVIPVK